MRVAEKERLHWFFRADATAMETAPRRRYCHGNATRPRQPSQ